MDHKEIGYEDVSWIHLAQDRDQWQVILNTVQFGLDKMRRISWPAERHLASKQRLSVEL
jgi:hypothetical protein